MSTEREVVARAIKAIKVFRPSPEDLADAAIAALDAHRAGQVCVWKACPFPGVAAADGWYAGCQSVNVHRTKMLKFCPDCGKRVEVKP